MLSIQAICTMCGSFSRSSSGVLKSHPWDGWTSGSNSSYKLCINAAVLACSNLEGPPSFPCIIWFLLFQNWIPKSITAVTIFCAHMFFFIYILRCRTYLFPSCAYLSQHKVIPPYVLLLCECQGEPLICRKFVSIDWCVKFSCDATNSTSYCHTSIWIRQLHYLLV